jgi:hypothetical protein
VTRGGNLSRGNIQLHPHLCDHRCLGNHRRPEVDPELARPLERVNQRSASSSMATVPPGTAKLVNSMVTVPPGTAKLVNSMVTVPPGTAKLVSSMATVPPGTAKLISSMASPIPPDTAKLVSSIAPLLFFLWLAWGQKSEEWWV